MPASVIHFPSRARMQELEAEVANLNASIAKAHEALLKAHEALLKYDAEMKYRKFYQDLATARLLRIIELEGLLYAED